MKWVKLSIFKIALDKETKLTQISNKILKI